MKRKEFIEATIGLFLLGCKTDTRTSPQATGGPPRPPGEQTSSAAAPAKTIPEIRPTVQPSPIKETSSSDVTFEFGEGVTDEQQKEIKDDVTIARDWLSSKAGIKIDGVYVYASSKPGEVVDKYLGRTIFPQRSEEDRKGLARATAFTGEKKDFFIITSSPGWTRASPIIGVGGPGPVREGRTHTIVHEYFHIFQREVGGYNGSFPHWLNEGGAHYIAARALHDKGIYSYRKIREGHTMEAKKVKETLNSMESAQGFYNAGTPGIADEYSLGFLATEFLVKDLPNEGVPALVKFWQETGKRKSPNEPWQPAFQIAFGKTPDQFYSEFETWRQKGFS